MEYYVDGIQFKHNDKTKLANLRLLGGAAMDEVLNFAHRSKKINWLRA